MNGATGNRLAAYLRAEVCLEHAQADLDEIVRTLPGHHTEHEMASPGLLLLLVRAVAARRHLNDAGAALELERT
jgi:hypothetical protein